MADPVLDSIGPNAGLLIGDGDQNFGEALATQMYERGFEPHTAKTRSQCLEHIEAASPAYAVVDLRFRHGMGFDVVRALRERNQNARVVILSGYGELAHVVAAIKMGAVDYLTKPSDPDTIDRALRTPLGKMSPPPEIAQDTADVQWNHIMRIYHRCEGNVTETAEQLKMHRRTLQRMIKQRNIPRPYVKPPN